MIKLVVSDLDGTLLHNDKSLPTGLGKMIDELALRGVTFALATSRDLSVIRKSFSPYVGRMAVICSNGCILAVNDDVKYVYTLSDGELDYLLEAASRVEGLYPVFCGLKNGYYIDEDPRFVKTLLRYCENPVHVENAAEARTQDRFNRISFYDVVDPIKNGMEKMQSVTDVFILTPSGDGWLDTVRKGQDKGVGLKRLQDMLGIRKEETLCFGDYHNDAGLMEHCDYSYAMKNAHPDLKSLCRSETRLTNEEDGVIDTVASLFGFEA